MCDRGNGPALAQGQYTLAKVGSTHYPGSPDIINWCIKLSSVYNPVPSSDSKYYYSFKATACAVFKGMTILARS